MRTVYASRQNDAAKSAFLDIEFRVGRRKSRNLQLRQNYESHRLQVLYTICRGVKGLPWKSHQNWVRRFGVILVENMTNLNQILESLMRLN